MKNGATGINYLILNLSSRVRLTLLLFLTGVLVAGDIFTPAYISSTGYYFSVLFLAIWYFENLIAFAVVFPVSLATRIYVAYREIPSGSPSWQFALSAISIFMAFSAFSKISYDFRKFFTKYRAQSERDELTGLRNRRGFLSEAHIELSRMNRMKSPGTLVMMDIDNFKNLNDSKGHVVGDQFLINFSQYLSTSVREGDIVARLGGDEFVIMLPNTNSEASSIILHRLHENMQRLLKSYELNLGCSIGAISFTPERSQNILSLMDKADALMYDVKQHGKNRVHVQNLNSK